MEINILIKMGHKLYYKPEQAIKNPVIKICIGKIVLNTKHLVSNPKNKHL